MPSKTLYPFSIHCSLVVALLAGGVAIPTFVAAQNVDLATLNQGPQSTGFALLGYGGRSESGFSISGAGDVNGDGFADVLVGARGENVLGTRKRAAGVSYVFFGKAADFKNLALGTMIDNATVDGFSIQGATRYDQSGFSVSGAGDVNADGFDDIIIGARYADGGSDSRDRAGDSYVIFGKASGIENINLVDFDEESTEDGFAVWGASIRDQSGYCVSGAGDVNGDGFADLLIGVPFGNGSDVLESDIGFSYVLFGKASGFTNIDLASFHGGSTPSGFAIKGAGPGDQSGFSLSGAGDVNGDGFADIIIGANYADGPNDERINAGESYVLFGKESGFTTVNLASFNAGATADGFAIFGARISDNSGFSVSGAGDLNGDGFAEILIGAKFGIGAGDGFFRPGHSYVLFGKASGFSNIDLVTFDTGATADGFAILGVNSYDLSGWSVAGASDLNGDGFSDLLISARAGDGPSDTREDAGNSYVIFGKQSGFNNIELGTLELGPSDDGFAIFGSEAEDFSGKAVSGVGDVNGEGFADFIIGAYGADPPGNEGSFTGQSYVLYGKGMATSATYQSFAKQGNAPNMAIGITGDGSNNGTPDSRVWIDFADGNNVSLQTVTLTRKNSSITELSDTANVMWQISSDRTGWTSAEVTFKYTNTEFLGLSESSLKLITAPEVTGPWTEVSETTQAPERNQIKGTVSGFGYFAIQGTPNDPADLWMVQ